jgi:hypothetical protein
MTSLDLGVIGAKRQSWKTNPQELLRRIMEQNPTASRSDIFNEFKTALDKRPACLEGVIEYWFSNYFRRLDGVNPKERDRLRDKEKDRLGSALDGKLKEYAGIVLLEMLMPNGKKLRDCTGAECKELSSKIGAWLLRVSKQVKPDALVGDVLTEKQVRTLFR